jgi:hypothetical protein
LFLNLFDCCCSVPWPESVESALQTRIKKDTGTMETMETSLQTESNFVPMEETVGTRPIEGWTSAESPANFESIESMESTEQTNLEYHPRVEYVFPTSTNELPSNENTFVPIHEQIKQKFFEAEQQTENKQQQIETVNTKKK